MKKDSAHGHDGILALEGVREAWALSSFSTLISICWKEVPFLSTLLKVGRLFLR